jgi:hypothetical protein
VSITRTAGTGVTPFQFTNVVVGPGIQPQGAVVGLHTSYAAVAGTTIVGTTTNPTFGTTSKNLVNIERRGSWAKITWTYIQTTAGTAGSGAYYGFKMPSGLTIDTGLLGNSTAGIPGAGSCGYLSVNGLRNYTAAASDSQTIYFRDVAIGANWAPADSAHNFAQSSLTMELTIEVPVNEWAGSGTVQLAQNDVEYAYNSIEGTTIGTSYTNTAFVKYGPAGGTFPGITSKDTTSGYTSYIVQFQSPIQSGDKISLEYSSDNGVTWVDNTTSFEVQPFNQGTTYIGMDWAPNSSNSVLVRFGRGGREAPTTYAAAGSATWNTLAGISTRRWRVRKSSAGAAVGYGIVAKDQSGLLPAYNTNLDDATATRLGLKQYLHGTAYNGGIAPTVTCPQAGFAITRATFIPYQMQDGVWRVKFNIIATFSTATITSLVFTINGITFASIQQAVLSNFFNSLTNYAYTNVSASTINIVTASSSDNGVKLFGDVELASKPTWAYS